MAISFRPDPKPATYRNEKLRRAVASLECMACGIEGHTQAAHVNEHKGGAIKSSDATIMALCGPRPGIPGCHAGTDAESEGAREARRAWEAEMNRRTLVALIERGLLKVGK